MGINDRIPGFAICACCAGRRELSACHDCGLLVCSECRRAQACAACERDRRVAAARARRRARWAELGRRTALTALVAASGVAGIGAAMLPEAYAPAAAMAPVRLDLVPESETIATAPGWGEPMQLSCVLANDHLVYCVLSPR